MIILLHYADYANAVQLIHATRFVVGEPIDQQRRRILPIAKQHAAEIECYEWINWDRFNQDGVAYDEANDDIYVCVEIENGFSSEGFDTRNTMNIRSALDIEQYVERQKEHKQKVLYQRLIEALTNEQWQEWIAGRHPHTYAKEQGWRQQAASRKRGRRGDCIQTQAGINSPDEGD